VFLFRFSEISDDEKIEVRVSRFRRQSFGVRGGYLFCRHGSAYQMDFSLPLTPELFSCNGRIKLYSFGNEG